MVDNKKYQCKKCLDTVSRKLKKCKRCGSKNSFIEEKDEELDYE